MLAAKVGVFAGAGLVTGLVVLFWFFFDCEAILSKQAPGRRPD